MPVRGTTSQRGGAAGARLPTRPRELDHRHVALSLTIREASDADLRGIAWTGLDREQQRALEATLRRCARGEEVVLVATSREAPLAVIRARLSRRSEPDTTSIESLRVMPGLHGLGIATALLAALERVLRERGRSAIEVRVAPGSEAELARYARVGYATVGTDSEGRVVLRKSLDLLAARPLHLQIVDPTARAR